MKLNYDKKSKDPTYFIQMGIRNGKKTTTKNIARIGRHSDLLKITDDPLSYAKGQVAKYTEEAKLQKIGMPADPGNIFCSSFFPIPDTELDEIGRVF